MTIAKLNLTPSTLNDTEQQLLMAHACGLTNSQIARHLGADLSTVNLLNRQLMNKLEAKTLPHAISQAFIKGLLAIHAGVRTIDGENVMRSLCLCLVVITSLQSLDPNMLRTRSPMRNNRNPNTVLRVAAAGRNKDIDV